MNLKVIKGGILTKEEKYLRKEQKLSHIYLQQFLKHYLYTQNDKRIVYNGIKYINHNLLGTNTKNKDFAKQMWVIDIVMYSLEKITYNDFIEMFPLCKIYDKNDKFGIKDYYYTQKILSEFNLEDKIGNNAQYLIDEYANNDIMSFGAKKLLYTIKLSQLDTLKLLENFFGTLQGVVIKNGDKYFDKETGEEVSIVKEEDIEKQKIKERLKIITNDLEEL